MDKTRAMTFGETRKKSSRRMGDAFCTVSTRPSLIQVCPQDTLASGYFHTRGISGPSGGLHLVLDAATDEYPDMIINNFLEEGLLVSIDYNREPYLADPITLIPNTHSYISISATCQKYTKQKYPIFSMPCRENTELTYVNGTDLSIMPQVTFFMPKLVFLGLYSAANCRIDCLADAVYKMHGCVPLLEPKVPYKTCSPRYTMENVAKFFDGK